MSTTEPAPLTEIRLPAQKLEPWNLTITSVGPSALSLASISGDVNALAGRHALRVESEPGLIKITGQRPVLVGLAALAMQSRYAQISLSRAED